MVEVVRETVTAGVLDAFASQITLHDQPVNQQEMEFALAQEFSAHIVRPARDVFSPQRIGHARVKGSHRGACVHVDVSLFQIACKL